MKKMHTLIFSLMFSVNADKYTSENVFKFAVLECVYNF